MLIAGDEVYLKEKGRAFEVHKEGAAVLVVLKGYELPIAYQPRVVDLLIRLPAGYPQGNPDMFWTRPDVQKAGGGVPLKTEARQTFLGVPWQRWSRHWSGKWRPGADNLATFLAAIKSELERGL